VLRPDGGHDADLGARQAADLGDLAFHIGPHLHNEIIQRRFLPQGGIDRQGDAHQRIVAAGRGDRPVTPVEDVSQVVLGAGLAVAAGDADHGRLQPAEHPPRPLQVQPPQGGLDRGRQPVAGDQRQGRQQKEDHAHQRRQQVRGERQFRHRPRAGGPLREDRHHTKNERRGSQQTQRPLRADKLLLDFLLAAGPDGDQRRQAEDRQGEAVRRPFQQEEAEHQRRRPDQQRALPPPALRRMQQPAEVAAVLILLNLEEPGEAIDAGQPAQEPHDSHQCRHAYAISPDPTVRK